MANNGSHPEQSEFRQGAPPHTPHLALIPTLLWAVILAGCIGFIVWLHWTTPRVMRVPDPEEALTRTVQHMLDLEEALRQAPRWEQWIYDAMTGRTDELDVAIRWYRELAVFSPDPYVDVHLAILEAETGALDRVSGRLASWADRPPLQPFARILMAAYLRSHTSDPMLLELQAQWAEMLPAGWFYDQVAMHLARHASNKALWHATRQAMLARGDRLLWWHRLLAGTELGVLGLGFWALIRLVKRRVRASRAWQVGEAPLPPPWRGGTGVAVLIRGGAIGSLFAIGVMATGMQEVFVRVLAIPLINLPVLVLAVRYLTMPSGLSMSRAMGLLPSDLRALVSVMLLIVAAGVVGDLVIGLGAGWIEESAHWTEWYDPDLVGGSWPVVGITIVEYVVLAPVFEELVFRGLIYATLRRVFGLGGAAGVSAGIFALAHGYSLLGFASVLWSGLLWAWSYEKTGSLWPGILAHALNNLFVCLGMMAMLRMVT